jgi:hypothetical protein
MACAIAVWAGCRPRPATAPTAGTYGALTNSLATNVAPALPDRSATISPTSLLSVIETELSPATLWHSRASNLSFFANMPATGLGGPSFAAISTQKGPRIFAPGTNIPPELMRESWFVVWWAGATNWPDWDSPWFLTLQRKPAAIRFDTNGLHFTFRGEAGYAALMPLYGYFKPLQASQSASPFATLKEKKKRVLTWEWHMALPADPLARARYWASALKEFPLYCEDTFSVDRAHDAVVFRQRFRFLSWDDEWQTKHLKLAPVSPVLALAAQTGFPLTFSKKPFDMEIVTPQGPYHGIEGVDSYEVTVPVLRYVHETEKPNSATNVTRAELQGALERPDLESKAQVLPALWAYANASGDWDFVQQRWPAAQKVMASTGASWSVFGVQGTAAFGAQASAALACARMAYRLGDSDAYHHASSVFARALVQDWVRQRGLPYFRENQPWHSMEPFGTNAVLEMLRAGLAGWEIQHEKAMSNRWKTSDIDVARFFHDFLLTESERERTHVERLRPTERERLIPGAPASPFLTGLEATATQAASVLTQEIDARPHAWPHPVWRTWRTPAGTPWNFGAVTTSHRPPASWRSRALNWNARLLEAAEPEQ